MSIANAATEYANVTLDADQQAAVETACTAPVSVLTGGPGTGKTAVSRTIYERLGGFGGGVLAVSPTGKAAKVLSTSLGAPASTIHRALKFDPSCGGFLHHGGNPLNCSAVLVDESSMVPVQLMASLIDALPSRARIVCVGDADQLPSVGAGSVLRDLIASGRVPVSRLTRIYRQDPNSRIATNCAAINRGELPEFDGASDTSFEHVAEDRLADVLVSLVREQRAYDPFDLQVISPQHKGPAGVEVLNERLQDALNPDRGQPSVEFGATAIRVGDKVRQTRNDYTIEAERGEPGAFNGEVGRVLDVAGSGNDWRMRVDMGDRVCSYKREQTSGLVLAYAITVHASQGSAFPAAVVAASGAHRRMWSRQLLYTALSRPKRYAWVVGDASVIESAVANTTPHERRTGLRERLAVGS